MAEFVAPQFQYPDMLGSYLRGQQGAIQSALAPGALQLQGQEIQGGNLSLQQLQMALKFQQMKMGLVGNAYNEVMGGKQSTQTGNQPGAPTAGIENGPQGAVNQPQSSFRSLSPGTTFALGLVAPEELKGIKEAQDYNKTQAQLQAQGPLNLIDTAFNSDAPARVIMNNPSLIAKWPQVAAQLGIDPVKGFNDDNVRRGLAMAGNNLRGSVGLPAKDYPLPVQNVTLGQGEVGQIDPVTGKKIGTLTERQIPTFTLKPVWDPQTNTTKEIPVQTGGYGMQGVGPTGNVVGTGTKSKSGPVATATKNFPASAESLGFNTGFKPPTDPELKAAMFGSEMREGLQTLSKMEAQGFALNPAQRAAFISAASSEDSGAIHQFLSQEFLVHQSPDVQKYMTALMPLLQATGHDQSGARVTTAQIRQNLESTIPLSSNPGVIQQVNKNRQGFYVGLLGQAGSSTQLPQYKDTLGADLKQSQQKGSGKNISFDDPEKEARYQKWKAGHK